MLRPDMLLQPDPQRHAAFGPHFILAFRRNAVAGQLAKPLSFTFASKSPPFSL